MGEPLQRQPLVEALCEFQFSQSSGNELTLPGLFYAAVKDNFPIQESVNEFIFQVEVGDLKGHPEIMQSPQRLQLKRADGSAMLQIGRNRLIVNHLQPYVSWEDFRQIIFKAFKKYAEICESFELSKIGLRYINHILPGNETFKIEEFLTIIPFFPQSIDKTMVGFQQSYEFFHEDLDAILVHKTGVIQTQEGKIALLLDLDFISREVLSFDNSDQTFERIQKWLNHAHDRIEEAFLLSLNPSYYELLRTGNV
jgi:uncharacterized protein (TIGR04255 family)